MDVWDSPDTTIINLTDFNDLEYEAGGLLVKGKVDDDDVFAFVRIPNKFHNQSIGHALYEPNDNEFAKLVGPFLSRGWQLFGSFHTHPSFSARYSGIDYANLFQNFKYNYIKSIKYGEIIKYTWLDNDTIQSEVIWRKNEH